MGKVIRLEPMYKGKKGNDILAKLEAEDLQMIESLESSFACGVDYRYYLDTYCQTVRGVKSCRRKIKSGIKRNGKPYKESYLRELRPGATGESIPRLKPTIRLLAKLGFYRKPMGEAAQALMARARKDKERIDKFSLLLDALLTLAARYEEKKG